MKFTKEFIEQQKALTAKITPLPWHYCGCGKCGRISSDAVEEASEVCNVTRGNWGDDYPNIRRTGGSIEGKFELFMDQINYGNVPDEVADANAKYIEQACNNYPDALATIAELKAVLNSFYDGCWRADLEGELTEWIDGSLLDKARSMLFQPQDGEG